SFFFSIDVASPYPHSFPTRRSSDLKNPKLSDRWHITYRNAEVAIKLRLGLTSFKHVGVFPEQAVNWDYISGVIKAFRTPRPKVRSEEHTSELQSGENLVCRLLLEKK